MTVRMDCLFSSVLPLSTRDLILRSFLFSELGQVFQRKSKMIGVLGFSRKGIISFCGGSRWLSFLRRRNFSFTATVEHDGQPAFSRSAAPTNIKDNVSQVFIRSYRLFIFFVFLVSLSLAGRLSEELLWST